MTLLTLLTVLNIFHLPAKLFGFATQHFLLPALLRQLIRIGALLLLREVLLTARQFLQLLHGVVDLLLLLIGTATGGLGIGFVLVLFLIEFEIEQVGEIAAGSSAPTTSTAAPATAADLNLDIAEGRFGAQQVLQGLLFGLQRVLEGLAFQFFRGR